MEKALATATVEKQPYLDSHDNQTALFAKWIHERTKTGRIASADQCAGEIYKIKAAYGKIEVNVHSWIAKARQYCEAYLGCTLKNIRGEGWRVADRRETAIFYCESVKKTIAWADRTTRLQLITDKHEIPAAMQQVFFKAEGGIKTLSKTKRKYFEGWMTYLKEEKEKNGAANGRLTNGAGN